jgi:hypothetical protein
MRNHILLLSTALLLAACTDDQHPTAATSAKAAGDVRPTVQSVTPQAKPADQVGFTKITKVTSLANFIWAGSTGTASVTCPAGSTVVGGTHRLYGYVATATPAWIVKSEDDSQNGWTVIIDNSQAGGQPVNVIAVAYCAS